MAYIKVPVSTPSDIPSQQQPHPQPQQHQQHHLHEMPNHIWQSHALHSPSSSPAIVSDPDDPVVSAAAHLAPLWPPADLAGYDLSSSSLPNLSLPSIPTIRPRTPHLPISSNNNDNPDPSADSDSLLRSFLDFRINDPTNDTATSNAQANDLLHRSASLQPNPFASAAPRHHQTHQSQQQHQSQHQRPSSARMASELRADSSLSHYLTSSAGPISLHASSSPNRSVYAQALAASSPIDLSSHPIGSPILRPSSVPPSSSPTIPPSPLAMGAIQAPNQAGPRIKNELYKTEICRTYAESGGYCKYGAKCQFAHGPDELRPVRRHPRYKTKLCRNFVTTGSCPYESRCRFIHDTKQTNEHIVHAAANQALSSASAGALGHHAHFPSGQQGLMGAKNQHLVDLQDSYAYNLRLFESSLSATNPFESFIDSINADQRAATAQPTDYLPDRSAALPASQVDYATANVFHDYPDNVAFHNRIMQLSGADSDLRFPTTDFPDHDLVHAAQQVSKPVTTISESDKIIGSPFVSSNSVTQRESLFSSAGTNNHAVSPPGPATSASLKLQTGKRVEGLEGTADAIPAGSPTSRSRLPVFRNMGVDDNAP